MIAKEMMGGIAYHGTDRNKSLENGIELLMIKFAKLKVQDALEAAARNAEIIWDGVPGIAEFQIIDKDSILNAYDINSIV